MTHWLSRISGQDLQWCWGMYIFRDLYQELLLRSILRAGGTAKYVFLALFHYFATYCQFKVAHWKMSMSPRRLQLILLSAIFFSQSTSSHSSFILSGWRNGADGKNILLNTNTPVNWNPFFFHSAVDAFRDFPPTSKNSHRPICFIAITLDFAHRWLSCPGPVSFLASHSFCNVLLMADWWSTCFPRSGRFLRTFRLTFTPPQWPVHLATWWHRAAGLYISPYLALVCEWDHRDVESKAWLQRVGCPLQLKIGVCPKSQGDVGLDT